MAVPGGHQLQSRRPAPDHPPARKPLEDSEGNIVELPDPALGPEASALARERIAAVREALLTLHPDFRAVVILRDVNELSYEEMSAALRIPIGTVKSRLSRARSMLAKALRGTAAAPGFAEEHA